MALNREIHIKWWPRTKVQWVEEGDKNTKYFHNLVRLRKRLNTVRLLKLDNGKCLQDPSTFCRYFADWYSNLWVDDHGDSSEDWSNCPSLPQVSVNKWSSLTSDFSNSEILTALKSMGQGKAQAWMATLSRTIIAHP